MTENTAKPAGYWQHLEQLVTSEVDIALGKTVDARRPLITYLRDLEQTARTDSERRQTVQVIASGRRLLGDTSDVGSPDAPFPRLMYSVP